MIIERFEKCNKYALFLKKQSYISCWNFKFYIFASVVSYI